MADNLLSNNLNPNFLYLSSDINGQLNYNQAFRDFLDKTSEKNSMITNQTQIIQKLLKAKKECLALEQKFYQYFNTDAKDYKSFKQVLNARLQEIDKNFLSDYIKLTNSGLRLQQGKDDELLFRILQRQKREKPKDEDKVKKVYYSKAFILEVKQAFLDTFSLTEKGALSEFGKEMYERYFHNIKIAYKIKDPVILGNIEVDFLDIFNSEEFKTNYMANLEEIFDMRIRAKDSFKISIYDIKDGVIFSLSQRLSDYFQRNGFKIELVNRKQEIIQISFSEESIKDVQRELYYDGQVPAKKARKFFNQQVEAITDKFQKSNSLYDHSMMENDPFLNPVLKRADLSAGWMGRLEKNGELNNLSSKIINWLQEYFLLTPVTCTMLRQRLKDNPEANKDIIRQFSSNSGIIGYFGEVLGELLFKSLFYGSQGLTIKGIGGEIGERKNEDRFSEIDKWRKSKQPPVDLLIEQAKEDGSSDKFGIQVKHSFSAEAQSNHAVGFINEKPIHQIFEEDLGSIPLNIKKELVPLLQGYYGNRTIQQYFSSISSDQENEKNKKSLGRENGIDILYAAPLINKIMSLFMDLIMDFGRYQDYSQENGVLQLYKERNIFLLYLNEYFIPASAIIDWAIQSFDKNKPPVVSVENGTSIEEMPSLISSLSSKGTEYNLAGTISSLEPIKMSVSVKFLKDNLVGYNFLNNFI